MDEDEKARVIAEAAGLGRIVEMDEDDILSAAASARAFRAALTEKDTPADEPWPPMTAGRRNDRP
ncbi:hypothetical protein FF124_00115 [Martelella lutilitoris]|uniref:Uncharacterized protein n=1 Tax=Martelella lutilitoris TaxID=2583532 RepID=A0A5C4JW79_9HYPH|nr:hypothetical protein [Martelella lutilitoris]TNB49411.1 hypothetical protein FF124_00115 [Martelella lutilitoris]